MRRAHHSPRSGRASRTSFGSTSTEGVEGSLPFVEVAPLAEFGPGSVKIVTLGWTSIGVYNCNGELYALEDRCSHDDGPLCEGEWEQDECRVICPRHGSAFDLRSGRPLTLPAVEPVATYPVKVEDGIVKVDVLDA